MNARARAASGSYPKSLARHATLTRVPKGRRGHVHAPPQHVLHRRFPDEGREPRRNRGVGHPGLVCHRLDGPRPARFAMDALNDAADLRNAERAQPSLLTIAVLREPTAYGLDDEKACQPRDHRLAAGPELARLARQEA